MLPSEFFVVITLSFDFAVLGYLYLNNGFLNDTQIIPEDWIELVTRLNLG